jgi:hypothetical protein
MNHNGIEITLLNFELTFDVLLFLLEMSNVYTFEPRFGSKGSRMN